MSPLQECHLVGVSSLQGRCVTCGVTGTFGEQLKWVTRLRVRPFLPVWALAWEKAVFQTLVLCEPFFPGGIILPPYWQERNMKAGQWANPWSLALNETWCFYKVAISVLESVGKAGGPWLCSWGPRLVAPSADSLSVLLYLPLRGCSRHPLSFCRSLCVPLSPFFPLPSGLLRPSLPPFFPSL